MFNRMKSRQGVITAAVLVGLSTFAMQGIGPALAQAETPQTDIAGLEEITVTARKRVESVLRTPVILQVVSAQQIKDFKINSLAAFADEAPGLQIVPGVGQIGTVIYLRGIGSGTAAAYIDQSVGLNIDGIGMSQGTFYKSGSFDMAQIEVLKGPQGLFFGKSTTAGMIVLHTADPTKEWETEASVGYEVNAAEWDLNGHVSGPITDKLGIRLAGYYDTMKGWIYNPNPDPTVIHRLGSSEGGGRLTLKWDDPDTGFHAKFKVGILHANTRQVPGPLQQAFNCPGGLIQNVQTAVYDNCKLDKYNRGFPNGPPYNPNYNWVGAFANTPANKAAFATGYPLPEYGDGTPRGLTHTLNGMLELDYEFLQGLTLTSTTGYSFVHTFDCSCLGFLGLSTPFATNGDWTEHDYSEEVRITSSWKDSWFNFMIGGLYAPSDNHLIAEDVLPQARLFSQETLKQSTRDASGFGQIMLTPIDKWEFDAGVRFTHVHKYFTSLSTYNDANPAVNYVNEVPFIPTNFTNISEDNTSPEFTLSYHPTEDWTIFTSYKFGYKGPGFNENTFNNNNFMVNHGTPFGGEKTKGVEGGVKATLLDRHLSVTAAAYDFKFIGLQVSNYNLVTQVIDVNNGANATTKGFELGASYLPPGVAGLQINGYFAYNDAKFTSFPGSPCWGGQVVATGCTLNSRGSRVQNLAGHPLAQAPKEVGSLGFSYERHVTADYSIAVAENTNFSSGYFTTADEIPDSYQKGYMTIDATMRFGKLDGPWEVALIGRNLTNNFHVVNSSDAGSAVPGVMGNVYGYIDRTRQFMIQLTVKPSFLRGPLFF